MGLEPRHWHVAAWWFLAFGITTIAFVIVGRVTGANLGNIIAALAVSFTRVLFAYWIALFLGAIIAFTVTRKEKTEAFFLPIFETAQSLPSTAIIPLMLIWLGNTGAVVFLLVITMIWPITFSVVSGIKSTNHSLSEAATVFGATGRKRFFSFTLPTLLPSIITGSTIGWGEGWEVIVAAEALGAIAGIGTLINTATLGKQYDLMGLALTLLMLMIFLINKWVWVPLLKKSTQHQGA